MYEVEVKIRADHDAVRAALEDRDAERVGRVRQVDTYYDAPHRDFAATDEALRVRRETRLGESAGGESAGETTARVTYKGPLVDEESKTRTEHETAVADGETMDAVLGGLGFEPAATVAKDRTFYRVGDYTVTLDDVDEVGSFVEVERETGAEADVESVREGAYAVARELGLDPENQIRTSYLGMLLGAEE